MANIKSAKKRIRIAEKKTAINRARKSEIKTYIRRFELALENNDIDEAKELLKSVDRKLKRAALRNIVHKNAASRTVSKLTKRLNKKIEEAI
ncbi:MAG TPA: 30S ribosomal protein S20 [Tepidimicrobium sp.]|nr:30S ribosomal protein S20 [Tepidimicrobium sp.]